MFEWHGWATIVASAGVDDDEQSEQTQDRVVAAVRALVAERQRVHNEVLDLRTVNGLEYLWFAGGHNHPDPEPVELFRAIARAAPGSYGILHTHDHDVHGPWNRWVMKRGELAHETEHTLSPHRGAVEDIEPTD